jgi:hypothetical protein
MKLLAKVNKNGKKFITTTNNHTFFLCTGSRDKNKEPITKEEALQLCPNLEEILKYEAPHHGEVRDGYRYCKGIKTSPGWGGKWIKSGWYKL